MAKNNYPCKILKSKAQSNYNISKSIVSCCLEPYTWFENCNNQLSGATCHVC